MKFRILNLSLIGGIIVSTAILNSCSKGDDDKPSKENADDITSTYTVSKADVINNYNTYYLGSELADCGWTGDVSNCDAGSVPQSTHDQVIKRINYFRQLVGLNNNTTLDDTKFSIYQEAALIMSANSQLSHTPPNTWSCWSQEGYDGAYTSNLSLGSHSTKAITSFIRDDGIYNVDVGHRRWILHSSKTKFSYGTTNNSMSLGVIGLANGNTQIPSFIAYPPIGYMPQELVFRRWSFSVPNADFTDAKVVMTDANGTVIDLTIESRGEINYGDRTIVWVPEEISTNSDSDVTYIITISDISNAPESTYVYGVTIIKP